MGQIEEVGWHELTASTCDPASARQRKAHPAPRERAKAAVAKGKAGYRDLTDVGTQTNAGTWGSLWTPPQNPSLVGTNRPTADCWVRLLGQLRGGLLLVKELSVDRKIANRGHFSLQPQPTTVTFPERGPRLDTI